MPCSARWSRARTRVDKIEGGGHGQRRRHERRPHDARRRSRRPRSRLKPHALHLRSPPRRFAARRSSREFERFLGEAAPGADALYILGDLFEYWAGDDGLGTPLPRLASRRTLAATSRDDAPSLHARQPRLPRGERVRAAHTGIELHRRSHSIDLYGTRTRAARMATRSARTTPPTRRFRAQVRDPRVAEGGARARRSRERAGDRRRDARAESEGAKAGKDHGGSWTSPRRGGATHSHDLRLRPADDPRSHASARTPRDIDIDGREARALGAARLVRTRRLPRGVAGRDRALAALSGGLKARVRDRRRGSPGIFESVYALGDADHAVAASIPSMTPRSSRCWDAAARRLADASAASPVARRASLRAIHSCGAPAGVSCAMARHVHGDHYLRAERPRGADQRSTMPRYRRRRRLWSLRRAPRLNPGRSRPRHAPRAPVSPRLKRGRACRSDRRVASRHEHRGEAARWCGPSRARSRRSGWLAAVGIA